MARHRSAAPARGARRQCTVCHQWKPAHRIWRTGACFTCVEFAKPASTPLPAAPAGPQGLISALGTSEANQRLTNAHAALQDVRSQLAEDSRRASRLAAQRETARQMDAQAHAIAAELEDVDQLELISQAPDLARRLYERREES